MNPIKVRSIVLLLIVSSLVLAGCTSAQNGEGIYSSPEDNQDGGMNNPSEIAMDDNTFQPTEITISVGTEITWANRDSYEHTVTAGKRGSPTGEFDASVQPGGTFSYTFEEAGTYDYFCSIHPGMDGTVIVE